MNTYRNDPDSDPNTSDTRDNERAVFAAKMQTQHAHDIDHESTETLFRRWQDLPEPEHSLLAELEFCRLFGSRQAGLSSSRDGLRDEALLFFRKMEQRLQEAEERLGRVEKRRVEVAS